MSFFFFSFLFTHAVVNVFVCVVQNAFVVTSSQSLKEFYTEAEKLVKLMLFLWAKIIVLHACLCLL